MKLILIIKKLKLTIQFEKDYGNYANYTINMVSEIVVIITDLKGEKTWMKKENVNSEPEFLLITSTLWPVHLHLQ